MKRAKVVLSTGFLLLGLAGCASTSGSGGAARDPNLISRSLLREAEPEGISAFQLIDRLRSRWLQTRGATSVTNSASYAMVVLDDVRHGELNTLLNMDLVGIEEMRFLNARDATTRFERGRGPPRRRYTDFRSWFGCWHGRRCESGISSPSVGF